MIVVNNDNNIVIGYSHIKIEVNSEGHIICWNDNDTWYGLAGFDNYTIYEEQSLYPPSLDKMWFYIDGSFIEFQPEPAQKPDGL